MKISFKIHELERLGQKLGIYTIRKHTKTGRIEISSLVYETKNKNEAELKLKQLQQNKEQL